MKRSTWITIAAVASVAMAACDNDKVVEVVHLRGTDVDGPRAQSSPENVVENLALAHRLLDIDLYKQQLDPSFTVRFSRAASFGEYNFGEEMSYDSDIASTARLFGDARSIEYEMIYERPKPSTVKGYPGSSGYQVVKVHSINIRVALAGHDEGIEVSDDQTIYVLKNCGTADRAEWRVVLQQLYWPGDEPKDDPS